MEPISPAPPDPPDPMDQTPIPNSFPTKRRLDNNDPHNPPKKPITNLELATASVQTIYTDPAHSVLGIKSYTDTDSGPFIVHVSRTSPDPAAGLSIRPIKFGQLLVANKIKDIGQEGVKRIGRNKIAVQFNSATGANNFLDNPIIKSGGYDAFIPSFNVTKMGLVRGVPLDISMEELATSAVIPGGKSKIIKARRMSRKVKSDDNVSWQPTQTVVLTFRGQVLPQEIRAFHTKLDVMTYFFPTIQCNNCCRFGHIKAQCRSKPRCPRCAQPHSGEECNVQDNEVSCLYCSGRHSATSKLCPEQDRQKTIKMIMSRDGISYAEASTQVPKSVRSFSEALRTQPQPTAPSSSKDNSESVNSVHNVGYKKTVYYTPRPRPALGPQYDESAHQSIISTPPSLLPNGFALQRDQDSSAQSSQDQLLVQLITIIINILSQNPSSLPSNVANVISQLSSYISHNGCNVSNTVEL